MTTAGQCRLYSSTCLWKEVSSAPSVEVWLRSNYVVPRDEPEVCNHKPKFNQDNANIVIECAKAKSSRDTCLSNANCDWAPACQANQELRDQQITGGNFYVAGRCEAYQFEYECLNDKADVHQRCSWLAPSFYAVPITTLGCTHKGSQNTNEA